MPSKSEFIELGLQGTAAPSAGVVSPVQTSTYVLGTYNPITFSAATQINASSNAGVYGGSSQSWTLANYGSVQGLSLGIDLESIGERPDQLGGDQRDRGQWHGRAASKRRLGHQQEQRVDQRQCRSRLSAAAAR